MAMAARLSLRMQKELKLLLTDPPPGASFPSLSADVSSSFLTSIDALLQGPHGTVYATGVFKIKIQIPERYPFQPPVVTFATPIYHPNIDNGGRICLNILNLPPKGTWQPSLNISTVLTSIGLLLSEPNPDDGLMHEASREYKYNRLAFDQNARTMTEKYATVTESGSSSAGPDNQTHTGPSSTQTETQGPDASTCTEHIVRFLGSGSKLSLGSLQSSSSNIYSESPRKSKAMRNKMSLPVALRGNGTSLKSHCTSMLDTKSTINNNQEPMPSSNIGSEYVKSSSVNVHKERQSLPYDKPGPQRDSDEKLLSVVRNEALPCPFYKSNCPGEVHIAGKGSCSTSVGLDEVLLSGPLGLPQCNFEAEKENLTPDRLADQPAAMNRPGGSKDNSENPPGTLSKFLHVKDDIPEDVIVLDSEDSEDEKVAVRTKLSLSRRCMPRKRKGNLAFYR